MSAHLLTGGCIYTANVRNEVFPYGSILWDEGRILAVGDAASVERHPAARTASRVTAEGFLVLPGFVNAHWHDLSAMRMAFNGALRDWDDRGDRPSFMAGGGNLGLISQTFGKFRGLGSAMTSEEAAAFSSYSLWTQVRAGTTTIGDVGSVNQPHSLVEAALKLGIRISVSTWAADIFCEPQSAEPIRISDVDEVLGEIAGLAAAHVGSHRVKVRPSAVYGVNMSDELGRGLSELVEKYRSGFATHVGALSNEREASLRHFGETPVRRLDRLGLLNEQLMAIHPAFLDDDEFSLLRAAAAHIGISPAKYGATGESVISGTDVVRRLRKAGAKVSVSTDGGPMPIGGMTEAMKMAWLSLNEIGSDNTAVLPSEALSMGSRIPAEALMWQESIGSLELGKHADLVLVKRTDWRYAFNPRPLEGLFGLGSSADVHSVIADGRYVLRAGKAVGVDEDALLLDYIESLASFSNRCLGIPKSVSDRLRRPINKGGLL